MTINNKHLKQHHDTWVYHRRVPQGLEHFYPDKTHIIKSLGTSSVKAARLKRDKINGEIAAKLQGAYSRERMEFKKYAEAVRPYAGALKDLDCGLSWDDVIPRNPIAKAAFRQEVYGETDHAFTITIKESLSSLLGHKTKISPDTRTKLQNTLMRFLKYLKVTDVALKDIHKRTVVEFVHYLGNEFAHATITAHLSRLKSIWTHAYQMGEVDSKVSPFCDHDLSQYRGEPSQKKQLFSKEQLRKVLKDCPEEIRNLTRLALFTGARLSELCNAEVEEIDGIRCLVVRKGKTASAVRKIPIAPQVADIPLPLNIDTKTAGRTFSRFKVSDVTDDSSRSFHSLRVHFITAAQRAGNVSEFNVATVVGHKTGTTMSFDYYAKGDIKRLDETVRKVANQIDVEWLS